MASATAFAAVAAAAAAAAAPLHGLCYCFCCCCCCHSCGCCGCAPTPPQTPRPLPMVAPLSLVVFPPVQSCTAQHDAIKTETSSLCCCCYCYPPTSPNALPPPPPEEPHSKRLKVRLTIRKEVLNKVMLQQETTVEVCTQHCCTQLVVVLINADCCLPWWLWW